MRKLHIPDVNSGDSSSEATQGTGQVSQVSQSSGDVKQDQQTSSTADDDNSEQQSSTEDVNSEEKSESVEDIKSRINEKYRKDKNEKNEKKEGEASSPDPEKKKSEDLDKILTPKEQQAKQKAEKEAELVKSDADLKDLDPKKPVPYERFKDVIAKKNDAVKQLETSKPLIERATQIQQFMQKSQLIDTDLNTALEVVALIKSNPQEGVKKLEELKQQLLLQTGDRLPDDLQNELNEGLITEQAAKREAKLRAQLEQGKQQEITQAEQKTVQLRNSLTSEVNNWTQQTQAKDPDFKPKAAPADPDGKYEFVFSRFLQLWQTVPVKTIAEAVGLADRAYNEVNGFVTRVQPKPRQMKRPVSIQRSSRTNNNGEGSEGIDFSKPGWAHRVAQQNFNGE
jgi:hypothetical protein